MNYTCVVELVSGQVQNLGAWAKVSVDLVDRKAFSFDSKEAIVGCRGEKD